MLCEEVDDLRAECLRDGTLHLLESIVKDAVAGRPIVARMREIGIDVPRSGWTPLPGVTEYGPEAPAWYDCPQPMGCPRLAPASLGAVPRCHLSGKRMQERDGGPG
jgi:hypothetical protein